MHIQNRKLLAVTCMAALVGASSLNLHAADSAAQAKAREMLRQKMAELDAQGATASNSVVVVQTPAANAASTATVVTPEPAPVVHASTWTPSRLTPDQEAKVREALRQAMADQNAQQTGVQPAVAPVPSTPQVVVKPIQDAATPAPAVTPVAANPFQKLSPEEEQKVIEAERAELAHLKAADQAAAAAKAQPEKSAKIAVVKGGYSPVPPATTPAVAAIPASKEQRLSELLRLYKADKITPYEYHQERAKILAE